MSEGLHSDLALSDADNHPRRSARRHRAPVVWATHRPAPVALTPRRCLHPRAVGRTASITAHSRSQLRKRLAQRLLSWAKQNCCSKSETYWLWTLSRLRGRRYSGPRCRDDRHCGAATACSSTDMAFAYKANRRKDRILKLVSVAVQCVLAATPSEKFEPSASRLHCGKSKR